MSEDAPDPLAEFVAKRATREAAPVTAAFIGMSGSGKTLSALRFARGLVGPKGKIVGLDTEGRRMLIYADDPHVAGFEHVDFRPPYSSERFRAAVKAIIAQGADAIIIDSASHEHEAEGGMLEFADAEERRIGQVRGVSRQKWVRPKALHNRFVRTAVSAPAHVIFCIRQKRIVDMDAKPAKEIFVPVMDAGLIYDMMIAVELYDKGHAHFVRVPEPFLKHIEEGAQITVDHGRLLLEEASRTELPSDAEALRKEVDHQRHALEELARDSGLQSLGTAWKAIARTKVAAALKPELDRLKAIAAETDARHAAEERDRQPTEADRATGNLLDTADEEKFN